MRSIICAALSVGIAVAGSSGAFPQHVDVGIHAEPYYERSYRETANRRLPLALPSDKDRRDVMAPIRAADCGVFGYWDGERCVDTRVVPPDMR